MSDSRIDSQEGLERFFLDALKPPDRWQVGMEFEKLGVHPETGRAVSFSGPDGVESLLKRYASTFGWEPLLEEDRVLGLERGSSRITLEPGSQLELSGAPQVTLHELAAEVESHLKELGEVNDPGKIAWIGFGCQPVSEWDEIELLPKRRYDIMNRYLSRKGELGRTMMRATAALQLNLDYQSEEDAMEKFRLSMALSPLITAMYANSSISGGRPNGFLTRRAHIWQHTDMDRCGFIERLYHADAGFRDYVAYALDVPMLFVIRDGRWIEIAGEKTFRQYLEGGFQECRASWDDWVLHLSTLFTEARFKPYLEVRGADCPPPDLVLTFPALVKGLLYDREARREAWELVKSWGTIQRQALYLTISRISREGLRRQGRRNERGEDETVFLEPLEARLARGWVCPAREILTLWQGEWAGDVRRLVAHTRF